MAEKKIKRVAKLKDVPTVVRGSTDPDRCSQCGGKRRGYADDYFIKKCWCDEVQEVENPDWYDEN